MGRVLARQIILLPALLHILQKMSIHIYGL